MGWVEKVAKRFAKTASVTVTDSVKAEAKNVALNALPVVVGLGFAVAGFLIFRKSGVSPAKIPRIPSFSHTSMVTNNFFFDEAVKKEMLVKLLKQ